MAGVSGIPAALCSQLGAVQVRAIAEYLFVRLGASVSRERHVQIQLTFEDGVLRRTDIHIGPIRGPDGLERLADPVTAAG